MQQIEQARVEVSRGLDPSIRSQLGQYMTPFAIAEFMTALFGKIPQNARLLDAGAGMGALSIAFAQRAKKRICIDAYEIDSNLQKHLKDNLSRFAPKAHCTILKTDFIESAVVAAVRSEGARYTHTILNPPYKKIQSTSRHRGLLRLAGIETVNLYSAFVWLSILLLERGGRLVAIVPRSFCNGLYYRPFRRFILDQCSIEHIHVFHARNKAFRDDDVLQENVIVALRRGNAQSTVTVSHSTDAQFDDYHQRDVPFNEIVRESDPENYFHVPLVDNNLQPFAQEMKLRELGIDVCTGPVVDFRLKKWWLHAMEADAVPLVYPHDFGAFNHRASERHAKKPVALRRSPEVDKWLMPKGFYVAVKRFSAKEERRRIVAFVVDPSRIQGPLVGFENHWNIFHHKRGGLEATLAHGLCAYLNSERFEQMFRSFSGHTQVNATDLRNLTYPPLSRLCQLGKTVNGKKFSPSQLDSTVERLIHE